MPENDDKTINYFRKVYIALHQLEPENPYLVPAIASMRLLLIDAVGEEKQSELIGLWNEEIEMLKAASKETFDKEKKKDDESDKKTASQKKPKSYLKGYA